MTSLTREELREQIDTLRKQADSLTTRADSFEVLEGLCNAVDDVATVEFADGEQPLVDVAISAHSSRHQATITRAYAVPQEVAIAGLRAMQAMLEKMLAKETA